MIEILADRRDGLRRVAVVKDGILSDLYLDRIKNPGLVGAIYRGRVSGLLKGQKGAFVDIEGLPSSGWLPSGSGSLASGKTVIVQVKADAVDGKGVTLSADIAIPSRFFVYLPHGKNIAVSKRCGGPSERKQCLETVSPFLNGLSGGWVVRSGAMARDTALLKAEAAALESSWQAAMLSDASCILPPMNPIVRALVEHGSTVKNIIINDAETYDAALAWCEKMAPDLLGMLALHREPWPLFEKHDLDGAIAALSEPLVPMPDGGSIIIEHTAALTAIDVNGGGNTNHLAVNIMAAREIVRQLRLRQIGGQVVIDFLRMKGEGESKKLLSLLASEAGEDSAGVIVLGMTKMGLVELTRTRRTQSIDGLLKEGGE